MFDVKIFVDEDADTRLARRGTTYYSQIDSARTHDSYTRARAQSFETFATGGVTWWAC